MPVHDDLGKRMKTYEYVTRTYLTRRTPVIIRVDGKAFHTFTRGFQRPFDPILVSSMQRTMRYMCENIQGCVLGYTQSDEITLALVDYQKIETAAWFDYNIQKCSSIAASMATLVFNRFFREARLDWLIENTERHGDMKSSEYLAYRDAVNRAIANGGMFDARTFNIPKEEVCNMFYWRQLDAVRNSIQMVGQSQFSHSQLNGKSCNQIQEMLFSERGINWNDFPAHLKRGSCCVKVPNDDGVLKWKIDLEPPMFVGDGRAYIDNLVNL